MPDGNQPAKRSGPSPGWRTGPALALLVLPILLTLLGWQMWRAGGSRHLFSHLDPEYTYLLTGTALATGHWSVYTDHPGTPLQVLSAVVQRLRVPLGSERELWELALSDAEGSLRRLGWLLPPLAGSGLALLGCAVRRSGFSLGAALWAQTGGGWILTALMCVPRVLPESLLFGIACAYGAALLSWQRAPPGSARARRGALWAGLAAGTGIAAKVTFLPALIPLFLLGGNLRERASALATAGLALGGWLLPVAPHGGKMLAWYAGLAGRTGLYGSGEEGSFAVATVVRFARHLLVWEPYYLLLLGLGVAATVIRLGGKSLPAGTRREGLAWAGFHLGTLALVLKHPRLYYLQPSFVLLPAWLLLFPWSDWLGRGRLRRVALALLTVGFLAAWGGRFWSALHLPDALRANAREEERAEAQAAAFTPGGRLVQTLHASSRPLAFHYSLRYLAQPEYLAQRLREHYPDFLAYEYGQPFLSHFGEPVRPEVIADRPLLLHGSGPANPALSASIREHLRQSLGWRLEPLGAVGSEPFFLLLPAEPPADAELPEKSDPADPDLPPETPP